MKVYIAGSWHDRNHLRTVRDTLTFFGHQVTSRWLDVDENCSHFESAEMDKADVEAADVVAVFMDVPSSKGGYQVEFGMGIGMKKRVIAIGEPFTIASSHVFCALPEVRIIYGGLNQLVEILKEPLKEAV